MTTLSTEKQVTITIDGQTIQVPVGTNLIEAAGLIKKEIPHFCYHPKLSISGNCRMCLVELGFYAKDRSTGALLLDANGNSQITWGLKPAIACATTVSEGLQVRTQSDLIKKCQEGVMEFLLINHPLDCPICDQAGECRLQEFATDYGKGYSRFIENKTVKPKRTVLGPRVMLDDERCILCSRCVRFCKEVVKDDVLGFIDRGSYSTLACHPDKQLTNNYSLNTVDICPVGALTSTDFRFKMRVWFLKAISSICTESSAGVNTQVWVREGKIYRITPRRNDQVNDTWMSDSGRMLYKQVEAENRLSTYSVQNQQSSAQVALEQTAEYLKNGKVAYVVSGHCSVEEHYLVTKLVEQAPGSVHGIQRLQPDDGLLISMDSTPNLRGAFVTGLLKALPHVTLDSLAAKIRAQEVDTLFVYNEDVTTGGIAVKDLEKVNVIYVGTHHNATAQVASVVLPSLTVFEKAGTFINQQFRLQKFLQAIPGPRGVWEDSVLLSQLIALLKATPQTDYANIDELWNALSMKCTYLKGIHFSTIPEEGVVIDSNPFNHIQFSEKAGLHYQPVTIL
jgi:NADH-quinone oxidoreductase subunit G